MQDKLNPEYHYLINKLISFSMNVDLTYDVLRAIAFELNNGYSFEETLMDLNISKENTSRYNVRIEFADGTIRTATNERINTYSAETTYLWFRSRNGRSQDAIRLDFSPTDITIDMERGMMTLEPGLTERYVDEDYFDMDKPEEKARYEYLCELPITKITFTKVVNDYAYKYMV